LIEKENPIQKAVRNVKTNFIDFVDENTDADDNCHNPILAHWLLI
jgi:hypothetical protein